MRGNLWLDEPETAQLRIAVSPHQGACKRLKLGVLPPSEAAIFRPSPALS